VLAILALWLGLRHHRKIKSRHPASNRNGTQNPFLKPAGGSDRPKYGDSAAATPHSPAPSSRPPLPRTRFQNQEWPSQSLVAHPKASTNEAAPPPEKSRRRQAKRIRCWKKRLYAAHGRPPRPSNIAGDHQASPSKTDAGRVAIHLFLSRHAQNSKKTAREFLKRFKRQPSWTGYGIGRTWIRTTRFMPMTTAFSLPPLIARHAKFTRPIGDVLMEMGCCPKQDLRNCLDDFDPKKTWRFGRIWCTQGNHPCATRSSLVEKARR